MYSLDSRSSYEDPEIYIRAGRTAYIRGEYDKALAYYKKALALDPNNLVGLYGLGASLICLGRYPEAASACTDLIRRDPSNSEAHRLAGEVYLMLGRHGEALQAYREATRLAPNCAENYKLLARMYRTGGDLNSAREALEIAKELGLDDPYYHVEWAYLCCASHDYEEALQHCERAVERDPNNAKVAYALGYTLLGLGKYSEARNAFRCVSSHPKFLLDALYGVGCAEYRMHNYSAAADAFQGVIDAQPRRLDAYRALAACLLRSWHLRAFWRTVVAYFKIALQS